MYTLYSKVGTSRFVSRILSAIFICSLFSSFSFAQATDVPKMISYQGQIKSISGANLNGIHKVTATLYPDPHSVDPVWQGEYTADISNGIFNISLGSGNSPLPDITVLDRPLWIGIRVDDGEEMQPLTELVAAPYAMNVPDQSITLTKLAPEVILDMHSGGTPTIQNDPDNWYRGGNAYSRTNSTPDFLGTNTGTGAGDLELRTQNEHAVRFEFTGSGKPPNIIGGGSSNSIGNGVGSIISGGGGSV